MKSPARSPRAFFAALILLTGLPLALGAAVAFGPGAEVCVHLTLAATFALISLAVFDFELPAWINVAACVAMAAFALIFALQAAHGLAPSPTLRHLAFDVLGQRLEKFLGLAFLLWCLAVLIADSTGATRLFGAVVMAIMVGAEVYGVAIARAGGETSGALKLMAFPLFLWLLLESRKKARSPRSWPSAP